MSRIQIPAALIERHALTQDEIRGRFHKGDVIFVGDAVYANGEMVERSFYAWVGTIEKARRAAATPAPAAAPAVTSAPAPAPAAAQAQPSAPAEMLATEKQTAFILKLLASRRASGEGGGYYSGPTTREGIAKMTRRAASAYITSLKGDY